MSPELAFLLTLGLRMAITAAFVVTASVVTERSGPVIGALVATLPISAGPSYVFLALDHDAAFIAEGALASLPINAATIFLGLTYVVLAQRHGALLSCARGGGGVVRARRGHPLGAMVAGRRPDRERHCLCDLRAAAARAIATSGCRRSGGAGTTFRCGPRWSRRWWRPWSRRRAGSAPR